MRTISLKISEPLERELDALVGQRHSNRSAVLREALSSLTKLRRRSALDLAGELAGSLRGAPDLSVSSAHMKGYGE